MLDLNLAREKCLVEDLLKVVFPNNDISSYVSSGMEYCTCIYIGSPYI